MADERRCPSHQAQRKIIAIRDAARYTFPTGDLEQMLDEIESGYLRDNPNQPIRYGITVDASPR